MFLIGKRFNSDDDNDDNKGDAGDDSDAEDSQYFVSACIMSERLIAFSRELSYLLIIISLKDRYY